MTTNRTQTVRIEQTTTADEAAKKKAEAAAAAPEKAAAVEEKGPPVTAVNLIIHTGADGKPEEIEPGTTFRPAKVDIDFLVKTEAVREPSEAELAIFERVEAAKATSAVDALG